MTGLPRFFLLLFKKVYIFILDFFVLQHVSSDPPISGNSYCSSYCNLLADFLSASLILKKHVTEGAN